MPFPSVVYSTREGQRFATDTTLVVVTCFTCQMKYAIPQSLQQSALAYPGGKPNGWSLCCPMGHTWHYLGDTYEEKIARAERRAQAERELREHTEYKLRAQKGATTKARKRHAAGVCPCCQRTFQQLRRHMESKHPDYDPARPA